MLKIYDPSPAAPKTKQGYLRLVEKGGSIKFYLVDERGEPVQAMARVCEDGSLHFFWMDPVVCRSYGIPLDENNCWETS